MLDIKISENAKSFLEELDDYELLKKIDNAILTLGRNPKAFPSKKIANHNPTLYRIRLPKSHRLTYQINYKKNYILIVKIGSRDKFYD